MNLQRILDKLDEQDARAAMFREETLTALGEIKTRIAVLETKDAGNKSGIAMVGWILTFLVSLAALGISLTARAQ